MDLELLKKIINLSNVVEHNLERIKKLEEDNRTIHDRFHAIEKKEPIKKKSLNNGIDDIDYEKVYLDSIRKTLIKEFINDLKSNKWINAIRLKWEARLVE